ncbi:MAG TPA: TRAP transporter large permease [Burkholderiales bacterium]|nr:TRAP transporter large permease [Burkholderiales bacterium]
MLALEVFGAFIAIALAGVPLVYAILIATVGAIWVKGLSDPLESIFLAYISGVEPFLLIAVPLFIFAGEVLSHGGVGKRIVNFTRTIFGFLPGGLGIVAVISCLLFGGVSGSALADTAAIGALVVPAMVARGYPRPFIAALLAVAGTLALLMPLSIPFVVFAFMAGVSMRDLGMAGIIPAVLMAVVLSLVCVWYGKKTGCDNGSTRATRREMWMAFKDAGPALVMPVIIVGGIWSGLFTPTEAAAVSVVYGLVVSLIVYRDITWRDLPRMLLSALRTSAVVMLIVGATGALAWLITAEQVAVQLAAMVTHVAKAPWEFLLLVNVVLLLLGMFIEPLPAMLLTAPLLLPIAQAYHIDLVHFGVVVTANLAIALVHPPAGPALFIAAKLAQVKIGAATRALLPLLAADLIVLVLITYIEPLSLVLVRHFR